MRTYLRTPIETRFWAKVQRTEECWLWTGSCGRNGYGHIGRAGHEGGWELAHRLSWVLHNGEIPAESHVLHRCDNPPCVRPDHLFLGTHKDNMRDMVAKGRSHLGSQQGSAILTEELVLQMHAERRNGDTFAMISRRHSVNAHTVRDALVGRNWKHIRPT